jgi:uncharacterized protein
LKNLVLGGNNKNNPKEGHMKRSLVVLGLGMLLLCGCASMQTSTKQYIDVDKKLAIHDYAGAVASLEASKEECYGKKDRVLYYLDLGMLYHLKGDYVKSNELLTNAEDAIDELYTNSISKAALSGILNDNSLDYSGADYEDVYLNAIKAVNYLQLNDPTNAFVEVRRINNKLSVLEERYNKLVEQYNTSDSTKIKMEPVACRFNNSALGRYLSMLMYRAEGKLDDARLDENNIKEAWNSQAQLYNFPMPNLDNYFLEDTSNVKVDFLCFVGKAPRLFSHTLTIHTFKDAVAVYTSDGKNEKQLNLFSWPLVKDGYHFKFDLPYMEKQKTCITKVAVEVNGVQQIELVSIESLENAAADTYKRKETMTYIKSVIRAVTKGILNEKANEKLDKTTGGGLMGSLTRLATGAVVDASENADLRLARYFPACALTGEIKLAPGTYSIRVLYYDSNGQIINTVDYGQQGIATGKFNFYPSTFLE